MPRDAAFCENVRRAATARGRRELGAFSVEGERLVRRALGAQLRPRALALGAHWAQAHEAARRELVEGVERRGGSCLYVDDAELLELSQGRNSGLALGLFELPPFVSLHSLASQAKCNMLPGARVALLGLLDVRDPGNVGALARTALACGVRAMWCLGPSDPYDPKAVRTSLGAVFRLSIAHATATDASLDQQAIAGLETLAALGIGSLATWLKAAQPLGALPRALAPLALLLGHEGRGLPESVARAAGWRASLEQAGEVDSFSVNAAAAIALHQLNRGSLRAPGSIRD